MYRQGFKLLTSMIIAGAMLLSFSTGASASSGVSVSGVSSSVVQAQKVANAEARAEQVYDETLKSLQATGSASFTALDGSRHNISVSDRGIVLDGKSEATKASPQVAGTSVFCKAKIAAAVAALAVVGVAYIAFLITGLSEATTVAIAGLSLTVVQWQAVIAGGISVGALSGLLEKVVC